ncbi:MAG: hypothetical protein QNK37_00620 [Acidobacteriota bacterium]|nr:hypothetical protein [Acidobacteriota bacterium]
MSYSWNKNFGKVKRLYPTSYSDDERVYFQLAGGQTAMNPNSGYYYLTRANKNYRVMVDLLYKAAEHRWMLYARTEPNLDNHGYARVVYLIVNW